MSYQSGPRLLGARQGLLAPHHEPQARDIGQWIYARGSDVRTAVALVYGFMVRGCAPECG